MINNEIMEELTKMRMDIMRETDGGRDLQKVMEWQERIAMQLKELNEFRFENKEKVN